jgi:tetratricopeptide (TPR) repeat protein
VDQRNAAPTLFAELMQHPEERRLVLVRNSARFRNWHLCGLLLDECRRSTSRHPGRAVHLAKLALGVVTELDEADFAPGAVKDLHARCWAWLSTARRKNGELIRTVEHALKRAEEYLAQGTGDPLEEAQVLGQKAALRGLQARFEECMSLFDRAAGILEHYGEDHALGRLLIQKGLYCGYSGDSEQAIKLLLQSLRLVNRQQEPRLVLVATHNLILNLSDMGRHEEAARQLEEKRSLYYELGDRIDLLRLRWVEGRIARGQGAMKEAEAALAETLAAFTSEGIALDAALAALDLATVYLLQGRTAEIKNLAKEILPFFKASDLHRQAFAALLLFQRAAEMERVSLGLIQDAIAKLAKLRAG